MTQVACNVACNLRRASGHPFSRISLAGSLCPSNGHTDGLAAEADVAAMRDFVGMRLMEQASSNLAREVTAGSGAEASKKLFQNLN